MTQVEVNEVGDMVLTEAAAMRALADPVRLALMDRLTRHGTATTAELAAHAGIEAEAASGHVEKLVEVGLVLSDGDGWRALGRGIYFEVPESGTKEVQVAARELANAMLLSNERLPRDWVEGTEPRLELEWARAAGLFNAGLSVTADELNTIQADLETLLTPYLNRTDPPADSRRVRILAYFLPSDGQHPAKHR
ncbi:helix-turn-helix protein [Kribbella steppae]|uniref:Helix-turn-helix protein n=1 Tax=Kribbella steppae TaxID=2512223 RepID=A0A4R2GS49_9ACTN|nr:helix-turn-helix domain-containing protein [Kribbella steppae]TCO12839.1 helix-turn-helix protein [Kribbella steppae]